MSPLSPAHTLAEASLGVVNPRGRCWCGLHGARTGARALAGTFAAASLGLVNPGSRLRRTSSRMAAAIASSTEGRGNMRSTSTVNTGSLGSAAWTEGVLIFGLDQKQEHSYPKRDGEAGRRRHMSSGGSQPNADMIVRIGFLGGSQPGWSSPNWARGSDGDSQPVAARGGESGWRRHMISGGSQPKAD